MQLPRIREYLDYRAFLRDLYRAKHACNKAFNYQYVVHLVGLKSPGHITSIFNGSRNIADQLIEPFADAFGLKRGDKTYFKNLVRFAQAHSHEQREKAFQKLIAFHRNSRKLIDPDIYRYFSHWYNPVVRELVAIMRVSKDDAEKIARYLTPRVAGKSIRRSLSLLEELGLIIMNENGFYERRDTVLTTGDGWRSVTIHRFQIAASDLAKQALENVDKDERDISSITLSCSHERLPELKEKLENLRREFLDTAAADENPDRVFQLNLQLFPLTRRID
ncbi:MAG: TIGR02147 family protein [Chitinivibrionales bacterium]|nr:TIGR02147 family protein [Chitinivibrionales bacterium]MBD3358209.1 TIGR02147 family protein [Chitinivibrionales bacterium]